MKFFAPRDWHILHFLLTLAIGIAVGLVIAYLYELNWSQMQNADARFTIWNTQNERINSLEKELKLAPELQEDGTYKHVPRPADYDEVSPSASEDYQETTKN